MFRVPVFSTFFYTVKVSVSEKSVHTAHKAFLGTKQLTLSNLRRFLHSSMIRNRICQSQASHVSTINAFTGSCRHVAFPRFRLDNGSPERFRALNSLANLCTVRIHKNILLVWSIRSTQRTSMNRNFATNSEWLAAQPQAISRARSSRADMRYITSLQRVSAPLHSIRGLVAFNWTPELCH